MMLRALVPFLAQFLALFLALLLPLARPAEAQLTRDAKALAEFSGKLDAASRAPDFVGLSVIVVENGETTLVRTYGVRQAGGSEPVTPDTVFRLASLSKGFAAVLAEIEARDGRLKLSDKAVRYVPNFQLRTPADTEKVTLEHILSHRVGLPPYAYDNLLEAGLSPFEILGRYKGVKLVCPVGDCFAYQNAAFDMIAPAIEAVSGAAYGEVLNRRVFDPLGMATASVGFRGLAATGNWARPHVRREDAWVPTTVRETYYQLAAAAGVNASITDMGKWLVALTGLRPDVLSADLLSDIRRPRIGTPVETRRQKALQMPVTETNYALGWRVTTYAGETLVSHTGSVEGYLAHIAFLPERKAGIAVLSNTRGARVMKIVPMWLDSELGLPPTDWMRLDEAFGGTAAEDAAGPPLAPGVR
jgi:beta-lactamase class C